MRAIGRRDRAEYLEREEAGKRGSKPEKAVEIELLEVHPSRAVDFAGEDGSDQIAAQHKEYVDTRPTARQHSE
jgi:hypothetical protein